MSAAKEHQGRKTSAIMIVWLFSAAFTFAQETNSTEASTVSTNLLTATNTSVTSFRTGPVKDDKYYEALKKWNAHEIKNIAEIEWIAHTVFTPAEEKQFRAIGVMLNKSTEVQAARKAQRDACFAAMCKADPTIVSVTEKLQNAWQTAAFEREAMAVLSPDEKAHYDKVFALALKSPEAGAAAQACKDAVRAAGIKIDPNYARLMERLESSYQVLRADFRYPSAPQKPETKPAVPHEGK